MIEWFEDTWFGRLRAYQIFLCAIFTSAVSLSNAIEETLPAEIPNTCIDLVVIETLETLEEDTQGCVSDIATSKGGIPLDADEGSLYFRYEALTPGQVRLNYSEISDTELYEQKYSGEQLAMSTTAEEILVNPGFPHTLRCSTCDLAIPDYYQEYRAMSETSDSEVAQENEVGDARRPAQRAEFKWVSFWSGLRWGIAPWIALIIVDALIVELDLD